MNNYSYQAGALRHFLPIVEKEDPQGSIAQHYREALWTMEYLAEKQKLLRELRVLDLSRPELKTVSEDIL